MSFITKRIVANLVLSFIVFACVSPTYAQAQPKTPETKEVKKQKQDPKEKVATEKQKTDTKKRAEKTAAKSTKKVDKKTANQGDEGIAFFKGTWSETLKEAKKQNKLIFVDAYTSWCGPCKKMARIVFPNPDVGKFYNKHYVCYKLDMEKGEGVQFRQKYAVKSFPTLLYINSEGEVVHKTIGAKKPAQFIAEGRKPLADDATLAKLSKKFETGEKDLPFLREYIELLLGKKGEIFEKVTSTYLSKLDKTALKERANIDMVFDLADNLDSPAFKLLTENRSFFEEAYSDEKIAKKVNRLAFNELKKAIKEKNAERFKKIITTLQEHGGERGEEYALRAELEYFRGMKEWALYAEAATSFLNTYEVDDWKVLNSVAWDFYEHVEEEEHLEKAQGWVERSIELKSNYHNNDTYAAILYKLGKRTDAILAAEKAIAIAKQDKKKPQEYKATEALLEKIIFE